MTLQLSDVSCVRIMQLTYRPSDPGGMFLLLQTRYLGNRDESPLTHNPDPKEI